MSITTVKGFTSAFQTLSWFALFLFRRRHRYKLSMGKDYRWL